MRVPTKARRERSILMIPEPLSQALASTLADGSISGGEKKALTEFLGDFVTSEQRRGALLHAVGELALGNLADPRDKKILEWVLDVVRCFPQVSALEPRRFESWFCPGEEATQRVIQLLDFSREKIDICVFTITDDRITAAILRAQGRGLKVRIVTDNDKANDLGSDIDRLAGAGIPVVRDPGPEHMHHKFAIFDERYLLTGSFNWTRATEKNLENFLVTDETQLLAPYQKEFGRLWEMFGGGG